MAEYKLTLAQVLNLSIELEGHKDQQSGEVKVKGILNQELNLLAKYWLTKLAKTVSEEKAKIEALRNELVRKYGEVDDSGNIQIKIYTDETQTAVNPKYIEFNQEFSTLLAEKTTINYEPIKLSLISKIDTTENYVILFDLVDAAA